jgi:sortase A
VGVVVRTWPEPAVLAVAALLLTACGGSSSSGQPDLPNAAGPTTGLSSAAPADPAESPSASNDEPTTESEAAPEAVVSDGRPRRATLTIPAIQLRDLPVVPYRGWTDDAPGTEIQNTGVAASPHGPRGGVGPGGVGNYQVTAHRTSSTAAFEDLPSLRRGDRVVVRAGGTRYVYEVRRTRETSFRSARSLAEQRAAVPGRPGVKPVQAFITLSTCATPEDHAQGNYWADQFGNPEHRIDKIGVLVRATERSR